MVVLLHYEVLVSRKTDIDPAYSEITGCRSSAEKAEAVFIGWRKLTLINAKIGIIFTLFCFKKREVINTENVTKSVNITVTYCWFTKSDHLILTKLSHFPSTLA